MSTPYDLELEDPPGIPAPPGAGITYPDAEPLPASWRWMHLARRQRYLQRAAAKRRQEAARAQQSAKVRET